MREGDKKRGAKASFVEGLAPEKLSTSELRRGRENSLYVYSFRRADNWMPVATTHITASPCSRKKVRFYRGVRLPQPDRINALN
jgi:hypothetical protein